MQKKIVIYGNGRQANFFNKILNKNLIFKNYNFKNLRKLNPDLIIVANSNNRHFKILKNIRIKKNILCEKPFCKNLKEAKFINNFFKKNKNCFVNYQYRFEPFIIFLKKIVEKKKIKNIKKINIEWISSGWNDKKKKINFRQIKSKGGGVINDLGSHIIDYLIFIFGNKIEIKDVKKTIKIKKRLNKKNKIKIIDAEDSAKINLKLDNKIKVFIKVSSVGNSQSYHSIKIFSEKEYFESYQNFPFKISNISMKFISNKKINTIDYKSNFYSRNLATKKLIADIFSKKKNISTFSSSVKVHEILNKIQNVGNGL